MPSADRQGEQAPCGGDRAEPGLKLVFDGDTGIVTVAPAMRRGDSAMNDQPSKKKVVLKKKPREGEPVMRIGIPVDDDAPPFPGMPTAAPSAKVHRETQPAEPVGRDPAGGEGETFKFFCVYCSQKLSAKRTVVGRNIHCPTCGRRIVIPPSPDSVPLKA